MEAELKELEVEHNGVRYQLMMPPGDIQILANGEC